MAVPQLDNHAGSGISEGFPSSDRLFMRRLQLILLVVGVALFVVVVRSVGIAAILDGIRHIGWGFVPIVAIEIAIDALHAEGWRYCLPAEARTVSRLDVFLTRTAGFAVNVLTPTATVGGEVVKGMLIRRWVRPAEGFASIILDKLTFAVGQAVFLVFGLFAVFGRVPFGPRERLYSLVAFGLWLAGLVAFFLLQRAGIFRLGVGVLQTVFGASALVERLPGRARTFDDRIQNFFIHHQRDLAISVLLHLLGQIARTLQFYLALSALGFEPSFETALTTAAGLVFVEATLFLVPARLGVFEESHVLMFEALGYGAASGLTVALTMRLSELCSALLGLGALAYYHFRVEDLPPIPEEVEEPPRAARASQGEKR